MTSRVMPALTLWQPWATLIAAGVKPYETRPSLPPHELRGRRIAIHAGLRPAAPLDITPSMDAVMVALTGDRYWYERLPYGAVVCVCVLDSVRPAQNVPADDFGNYSAGRWAWKLTDIVVLDPPVPARGQRDYGWPWSVPDDAWRQIQSGPTPGIPLLLSASSPMLPLREYDAS